MPRQLVLLTGPIASGKTTVARELAAEARRRGQTAAAIDLDDLVEMVAGDWGRVTSDDLSIARELAATIAETLFLHEVETVIIAGTTVSGDERRQLLRGFAIEPPTLFVLLRVSLDESIRRAQSNPLRGFWKEAALMEQIYAAIDWDIIPEPDVEVDTDGLTVSQVVALVAEQVLG